MRSVLLRSATKFNDLRLLNRPTRTIIDGGWYQSDCDALLLAAVGYHAKAWPCESGEISAFEHEINDVRVPQNDLSKARGLFLATIYARARLLAERLIVSAHDMPSGETMTAVIRLGVMSDYRTQGAMVRFFTLRSGGMPWLEDLEAFKREALMVVSSDDLP